MLNRFYAAIYFIIWHCLTIISIMLLFLAAKRVYWVVAMLVRQDGPAHLLKACCRLDQPELHQLPEGHRLLEEEDEELSEEEQRLNPKQVNPVQLADLRLIIRDRPLSDVFVYLTIASELNDPKVMNEIFRNIKTLYLDVGKELEAEDEV